MKFPSSEQWLYLCNLLVTRWVNSGKEIEKYYPKKILCIKWDEIGDMATCTHVFALLKKRFPDAEIHVITKKYSAELIKNDKNIDQIYSDLNAWNKRYDLVVELRGTWKTLWRTFRFYPKIRLDRGSVRIRQRGDQAHEIVTNYRTILPVLGNLEMENPRIYPGAENVKKCDEIIAKNNLQKYCIIHAGARRELRRWTDTGFAAIADWLITEKGLQVVFAGVEEEEEQLAKITGKMRQKALVLTRDVALLDLAALLEKCSLFIGNESGPLQIALAMNTPVVALFGPGVKNVFYPMPGARAKLIHHVLECNPCDQIHCVHPENTCMQRIQTEEVKAAIEDVLLEK